MKTLYIHIGTPKTATTSLQFFCGENQEALRKRGYDYPLFSYRYGKVAKYRNAHFLYADCFDNQGNRDQVEKQRRFEEGMEQIRKQFEIFEYVILSDEAIWGYVTGWRKNFWENMIREAKTRGFIIKVIVYLRRQDQYAQSLWNEKVKRKQTYQGNLSFEEFLHRQPPIISLDYYTVLGQIASFVGKENVIVRRFEKRFMKNQSVYEDFLGALGIEFQDDFVISKENRNPRINGNAREIKRILNQLPETEERWHDRFFYRAALKVSEIDEDPEKMSLFSAEETREFMEQYVEGNRKIVEEYIEIPAMENYKINNSVDDKKFGSANNESANIIEDGLKDVEDDPIAGVVDHNIPERGKDLFSMDFDEIQKWVPDSESMEDTMVLMLGEMAIALREENKVLEERLKGLEKESADQEKKLDSFKNKLKHPLKTTAGFIMSKGPWVRQ